MTRTYLTLCLAFVLLSASFGCGPSATVDGKSPRPVTTAKLVKRLPPEAAMVTASAGSWKKETIGFEIGGRVKYVVEPNTEIEGRVRDKDGNEITAGNPVAQLETERYALQLDKAKADVTRAEKNLLAARAQLIAAQATRTLAKTVYDRTAKLKSRDAASDAQVDQDKAEFESADAEVKRLDAEIASRQAALNVATQDQKDAKRDLDDCTLYSSFRGEISDISVVPGSVVNPGQAVATIQMMNPIKIEFEVSGAQSRRLQKIEHLKVQVTMPDGSLKEIPAYVYSIDAAADSRTRTFTVTLLMKNKKISQTAPANGVATTNQTWRLDFEFLPGAAEGNLFVDEKILLRDDQGQYLWQITNVEIGDNMPVDGKFQVKRLNVRRGPLKAPFLANWVFQQILVDDPEFDPAKNVVIGELTNMDQPSDWKGDTVVLDRGDRWMLRPGDLARVNLSVGAATAGYYVPMDAIVRKRGKSYIFVVEGKGEDAKAKRREIQLLDGNYAQTTALRHIALLNHDVKQSKVDRVNAIMNRGLDPTQEMAEIENVLKAYDAGGEAVEELRYITRGAHYLIDGEAIKVSSSREAVR